MTPELEQKVNELWEFMQALKADATIPYDVDGAFRSRFSDLISPLTLSDKGIDTEDVAAVTGVNFGASSTTTTQVLADPEAWLQVEVAGVTYYIPVFT